MKFLATTILTFFISLSLFSQNNGTKDTLVYLNTTNGELLITSEQILNAEKIQSNIDGIEIISFSVTFIEKGYLQEIKNNSDVLTEEIKSKLGALKPGAKFYIESIKAKTKAGKIIILPALAYKIK